MTPEPSESPLLRLARSIVGEEEIRALESVIERGYLGMGSEVEAFEQELATFIGGGREVVCVNSGTAALHLALQACGIGPGDEVLVPTLTYVASFQAISATGATPVACDVTADSCSLDVADAQRRVTARSRAIMPVHYASGPGDLDGVYALADEHGLRVVEDAAHAFGCTRRGERVGAAGDVVCFSFDGIKNITSGEGGAVVTADPAVAERVRDARLLGVRQDTERRYSGERSWEFDVVAQGWRYHMSDLMAAIGRVQLRRFDEFAAARVGAASRYLRLLSDVPGVRLLSLDYGSIVPHIFPVFVEDGRRDAMREALLAAGVQSGIHYKPNHLLTAYGGGAARLPVAERLYREMLSLPLHPGVTEDDQLRVASLVRAAASD